VAQNSAAKFARRGSQPALGTPDDQKPFGAEPARRNRQRECVKSTGPTAPQVRRVVCVVLRLAYDPLLIPGGLLPRRHLRRLSGIFPHVADREPLDLDLLLRVLLSLPLSVFAFGRLGKFSHGELQPGVFDATSVRAAAYGVSRWWQTYASQFRHGDIA
jgi:hypothetical protein